MKFRLFLMVIFVVFISACGESSGTSSLQAKEVVKGDSQETPGLMRVRMRLDEAWPSEQTQHEFVVSGKCALCHKSDKKGNQYQIWLNSRHAKAYETLGNPEGLALAAKLGVMNSQKNGKCLRCHSTAYFFGEQKVTEAITVEEGVSCESCHNPGKDYAKFNVMQDKGTAIAAGLGVVTEKTCRKCHNETAPGLEAFHFDESFEKIKHPVLIP